MPEASKCPQCGAPLPETTPGGRCPRCVLQLALENSGGASAPEKTAALPKQDLVIEQTGTMIGRYKLLQQIGEGGFGVVFMAEQTEPVQRKVALKIIKAGMDTREVIARFEAERQALALMDHPNIAQVLDAGATAGGRPYFVMELVRGLPITEYCDQANLSTRERLDLFIKVCRAVQHAHQKGVIHRDLKPSNVLVTLHDGEPVPKVIDFGVAKALGHKLTQKTLFTRFEQMIGTPAYMSPEQAALGGLNIDTRSDIYSLGVLLYELLTGVTPLDAETLRQGALDEIRRMIRETDPPKPSTRLLTLGAHLADVASHRHAEPGALCRLVRGDLDWITMKALEKERHRRYETVNGLAADIERHLYSEPVVARPPSALYRFQKLVWRHKLAFAAAIALVITLLLGITASSWEAVRARHAERSANDLREAARRHAEHADEARKRALATLAQNEALLDIMDITLYQDGGITNVGDASQKLRNAGEDWLAKEGITAAPETRQFVEDTVVRRTLAAEQLRGIVIVASVNDVRPEGLHGIRGIVVRGPGYLATKDFEKGMQSFLGRPMEFAKLVRIQRRIGELSARAGHPVVDVWFREQRVVDGVIQLAVEPPGRSRESVPGWLFQSR